MTDLRNSRVVMAMRRLAWLLRANPPRNRGRDCRFHSMAQFEGHPKNIHFADRVIIDAFAHLYCHKDGMISIGAGSYVGDHAIVHTGRSGGSIRIGRDSTLQSFSIVYGHGGVEIGDGVRIAAQTVIVPANHRFDIPGQPIYEQGLSCEGIRIGDDVWIGAGCVILDGTVIGAGSIVAAGAVVNTNVAPGDIVGGIPARVIGKRPT